MNITSNETVLSVGDGYDLTVSVGTPFCHLYIDYIKGNEDKIDFVLIATVNGKDYPVALRDMLDFRDSFKGVVSVDLPVTPDSLRFHITVRKLAVNFSNSNPPISFVPPAPVPEGDLDIQVKYFNYFN